MTKSRRIFYAQIERRGFRTASVRGGKPRSEYISPGCPPNSRPLRPVAGRIASSPVAILLYRYQHPALPRGQRISVEVTPHPTGRRGSRGPGALWRTARTHAPDARLGVVGDVKGYAHRLAAAAGAETRRTTGKGVWVTDIRLRPMFASRGDDAHPFLDSVIPAGYRR